MTFPVAFLAIAVAIASSPPAAATPPVADGDPEAVVRTLNGLDARVLRIGTRLAIAGRPICSGGGHASGLLVQTASQYSEDYRPAAARAFGVGDRPTVTVVVPGSAAARAGVGIGDQIVAVDSTPLSSVAASGKAGSFNAADAALDAIARGGEDGELRLDVLRSGAARAIVVAPDPACPARFDVLPGASLNANANGTYVQISSRLAQALDRDEDLAAVLAHEMAHNILGHPKTLDSLGGGLFAGFGKSGRVMRATEIAADRLSVYLLALAGYPLDRAVAFWTDFTRRFDYGILSDRTHPGWRARVAAIQEEVDRVAALRARGEPVRPPPALLSPSSGTSGDPLPARPR